MQLNLGCAKDNFLPRVVHQCCSQPLRCRAFRATPSTACQRSRSKSSSRDLAAHARFAKYTGDTGSSSQPASGTTGRSSSNSDSSKSASQASSQSKSSSQGVTPPPPRFAKYTGGAANSGPSTSKSDATSKSANRSVSQGRASSQSTSPPPKRFAKYTQDEDSDQSSSGSKTGATSKSPKFDDKQVQVQVYKPSGETSTEVRKVKVPAKDQSRRSGTESRANGDKALDDAADAVQDGVDQAEDAAQEGLDQLAEGISDAADQAQENADQFERDAQGVVDDIEEVFDDAADQAADQLSNAADQVQSAAQGAADIAANFANSLQKGAQSGSPYQTQPLSTLEQNPYEGKPGRKPSAEVQSNYFKLRLMECIAGLDRGFAANSFAAMQVESAALALTEQSQPVQLSWTAASDKDKDEEDKPSGLAQLSGTWRLVYSSGFSSGSIGGRQPGPPAGLLPARLGQVYQIISPYSSRLDNVLELYTGLPGFEPVVLTATLKHHFEAVGGNIVQITFEDTEIKVTGGIGGILGNLPEIMVPQLPEPFKPSRQQRTSSFDVLFLDSDVRITRGSRGELRIFVKT